MELFWYHEKWMCIWLPHILYELYHREGGLCVGFGNTEEGKGAGMNCSIPEVFQFYLLFWRRGILFVETRYQIQTLAILLPELCFRCRLTEVMRVLYLMHEVISVVFCLTDVTLYGGF